MDSSADSVPPYPKSVTEGTEVGLECQHLQLSKSPKDHTRNSQTSRQSACRFLYNLRHHGRTHFCQFGPEKYSTTLIRQTRTSRKEINTVKDINLRKILKYTTMLRCLLITQGKTVNCV